MIRKQTSARLSVASRLKALGSDFSRNTKGSVAIPMGLLSVMAFTAVGMSIDYARAVKAQHHIQDAVDAAVISASGYAEASQDEAEAAGHAIFDSFTADRIDFASLDRDLTIDEDSVYTYTAEGQVSTMILQIIGIDSIGVAASASAARGISGTEIVIALDTTGSMGFGNSWDEAKTAMADLLVDLDTLAEDQEDFHATFVPFSDRVNVGLERAEGWLSTPVPTHDEWGKHLVNSGSYPVTGKGCLEPREEMIDGNPHALTDKTPSELGFRPTAQGHYQSFLSKRNGFTCPTQPLMGPTTDIGSFSTEIESLGLSGTGRFDNTMAWMHRLLSPKWRGLWDTTGYPSDYGDRRKIAIFITDMHTVGFHYEVPNQTTNTQNTPNFGHNNATPKGLENFVEVCERMKADGIEVHTIYVNGNEHGIPYMQDCASSAVHYHPVSDVSDLRASLQQISSKIVDVRLRN